MEETHGSADTTASLSIFDVYDCIVPPHCGKWCPEDCMWTMAQPESKTDGDSYTETLPDDLYQWPHNPERFIPFQALSNSYPEYNFLGHYVYLIDGFLTTLPNSRIRSTSGSPSHATTGTGQYDRSHLVTWEEVGLYNLNVYGSWRANNIGTFYVDTNIVHVPYCPLGPPPSTGQQQHRMFKENGILQTRPWSHEEIEDRLGIRETRPVEYFRFSQYNKNAIGDWTPLTDGSGGFFVDCMKRNMQCFGRELVL